MGATCNECNGELGMYCWKCEVDFPWNILRLLINQQKEIERLKLDLESTREALEYRKEENDD